MELCTYYYIWEVNRMKNKWTVSFLLALLFVISLPVDSQVQAAPDRIVERFNAPLDPIVWDQLGVASVENGMLKLTPSSYSQTGTLWLNGGMAPPYKVSFRYKLTNLSSPDGADGFVFMFNKLQNENVLVGGGMGFEVGTGYGIEFDTYINEEWDPTSGSGHIALFKDTPAMNPPMQFEYANNMDDGEWHEVMIDLEVDKVRVYMDGVLRIDYDNGQPFDHSHQGIGFSASTGAFYEEHWIDDVVITKEPVVLKVTTSKVEAVPGEVVPIEVKFSAPVDVTGTPQLLLDDMDGIEERSVTEYVYGSGTDTLQFDYVVQPGEDWSLFEYKSTDALELNGGSIVSADGAMAPAILTLPPLGTEGSLGWSILEQMPYELELVLPETLLTNSEYTYEVYRTYADGRRVELSSEEYSIQVNGFGVADVYESDRVLSTFYAGTVDLELSDNEQTRIFTLEVLPFDIVRAFQKIEDYIAEYGSIEPLVAEGFLSRIDALVFDWFIID